jgi:hypothetical protein
VVGIIYPPPSFGKGLTELPNSGWAKVHPAYPLVALLYRVQFFWVFSL